MKLLGFEIAREKSIERTIQLAAEQAVTKALAHPGGSWSVIHDWQVGAYEQGLPALTDKQMTQQACVYACTTLIANSIAKLPINQIELKDGAWQKVPADYELLTRPSKIANRITWASYLVACMLTKGAGFGLKRYEKGRLRYIELLHPSTEVLVSESGEVFYRLSANIYSHLPEVQRTVPAQYIFHVPYNTLVHPLIGVPPLEAARAAALSGSAVMAKQARTHGTKPEIYGFLKVPATLTDTQAAAAKAAWQSSNGVDGAGVAVLRNGVEFQALQMTAKEAESAAALNLANEDIARAFGVPKHLLGIGTIPSAANAEALMLGFYSQTLQPIAELIELALDEALELSANVGVEFDVAALSRLDTKGRYEALSAAMGGGPLISMNEGRAQEGLPPVKGGEVPRVQMQDVPVDQPPPEPAPEPEPVPEPTPEDDEDDLDMKTAIELATKLGEQSGAIQSLGKDMQRVPDIVAGVVAKELGPLSVLVEKLSSEIESQKAEHAQQIKAAEEARIALEQKHAAEIKALRDENDGSAVEALTKELATLKKALAESKDEAAKANAALQATVGEVQALAKTASEHALEQKRELVSLGKSLKEIPPIPELPAELAKIPEVVLDLKARVESAEKFAAEGMYFAGQWDEQGEYRKGAAVACKNALWVAMRSDELGTPGDRDSGWKMCIKSGKLITPYEHR